MEWDYACIKSKYCDQVGVNYHGDGDEVVFQCPDFSGENKRFA